MAAAAAIPQRRHRTERRCSARSVATDLRLREFDFPFGATFIHEGPGGELYLGYSDNIVYRLEVE